MLSGLRSRGVLRTAGIWAVGLSTLASSLLIGGVELELVPSEIFGIRELIALGLATPGILPISVVAASVVGFGLIGAGFSVATLALARRAEERPVEQRLEQAAPASLPPTI